MAYNLIQFKIYHNFALNNEIAWKTCFGRSHITWQYIYPLKPRDTNIHLCISRGNMVQIAIFYLVQTVPKCSFAYFWFVLRFLIGQPHKKMRILPFWKVALIVIVIWNLSFRWCFVKCPNHHRPTFFDVVDFFM